MDSGILEIQEIYFSRSRKILSLEFCETCSHP